VPDRASQSWGEAVLPFSVPKRQIPIATQFRSTWLTSSILSLRERNKLEEYLALLPAEHHESVMNSVAGLWLPTEVAIAHYSACGALGFTTQEMIDIGLDVTRRVHGTMLSLMVRLAKGAGATPWVALENTQRLWERVWVGGAVAVFKVGPKEARMEIAGWPCSVVPYCRIALRGVTLGIVEMFCRKAYVLDLPRLCGPNELAYRIAWV
jgi:hypothetical protein